MKKIKKEIISIREELKNNYEKKAGTKSGEKQLRADWKKLKVC